MSGKSDALRLLNVIEQEATRASDKGEWLNAPWTVSLIREIRTALNDEAASPAALDVERLALLRGTLAAIADGRGPAQQMAQAALDRDDNYARPRDEEER